MGPRDLLRDVRHGNAPVESQAERGALIPHSGWDPEEVCKKFSSTLPLRCRSTLTTDANGAVPTTQSPTGQRPRIAGPNGNSGPGNHGRRHQAMQSKAPDQ